MLILPRRKAGLVVSKLFATTLYTGNGATQTITNGLDLSGKGGLVWTKERSNSGLHGSHNLYDTLRGDSILFTNSTNGQSAVDDFDHSSTGFTVKSSSRNNINSATYASWSFRRAPKFFDIVEWTGTAGFQWVAHNLTVPPGMALVKRLDAPSDWVAVHRGPVPSLSPTYAAGRDGTWLNRADAATYQYGTGNPSTKVGLGDENSIFVNTDWPSVNALGGRYVAYLFAHDDSAFGIIQCGSYAGNGSSTGPTVTLGWRPQWLLIKRTDGTGDWWIYDDKRDTSNPRNVKLLANSNAAEDTGGEDVDLLPTGFQPRDSAAGINASGGTYAYVAIRAPS